MKKYDSLIFDLDGTLWDASQTTAIAWNKVLKKLDLNFEIDATHVKSVAGLPFDECVNKLFNNYSDSKLLQELLDEAEKKEILKFGGLLYPEVKAVIYKLYQHYKLFVVSNCQDWYLQAFFDYSNLRSQFVDAVCFGDTGLKKSDNIRNLIKKHNLNHSVYIGDTEWDQQASFESGIDFIFASYGFGKNVTHQTITISSFRDLIIKLD